MKLVTAALHPRTLEVYRALFQVQLHDTVEAMRGHLRDWSCVHLVVLETGTLRRTVSRGDMAQVVLEQIKPDGCAYDPEVPLDDPALPKDTCVSVMPDAIRPKMVAEYTGWNYLPYPELRRRLKALETRIFGAVTATDTVDELFLRKDLPIALDGGMTTSGTQFTKALEDVCPKEGLATFCDGQYGFVAPMPAFFAQSGQILEMPGRKRNMVYFGETWFVAFHPNGRVRVGMIEA